MGKVFAEFSMSLDGYIAESDDEVMRLFAWYFSGKYAYTLNSGIEFRVDAESAVVLDELMENTGAMVSGRRTFEVSHGWGGEHPYGVPCFVVTHDVPTDWTYQTDAVTFVTDGIDYAIELAKAAADGKNVAAGSAAIARHCLNAGLLDEIHIHLVPVLLGSGVRLFDRLGDQNIVLEHTKSIAADGVTHLMYRVIKTDRNN
jgi:dihydrofolate reductase